MYEFMILVMVNVFSEKKRKKKKLKFYNVLCYFVWLCFKEIINIDEICIFMIE